MTETPLSDVLSTLRSLNLQDLDWELRKLQGIREWAIEHLGIDYRPGDRVRMVSSVPGNSTNGWRAYAECLHVGATGVVSKIEFVPPSDGRDGRWLADFTPDREWAVADYPVGEKTRRWHGPVDETPEGYKPPSEYEMEKYPDGRKHTFMFSVDWLEKVEVDG